ncbi:hypothetical protein E2C01_091330 [Portunus trituberculatus]|uniref:Uncharacterized protein n=1 Tax=Portunus trituberculatus TaxID=210409 RepID=A0A5B7JIT4_PORTR|nr:hypothetical protein [Portunus trituberculatus]
MSSSSDDAENCGCSSFGVPEESTEKKMPVDTSLAKCSFPSNIFSIPGDHIFTAYSVTSRRK